MGAQGNSIRQTTSSFKLTNLQAGPYPTVLPQGPFVCGQQLDGFVSAGSGGQHRFDPVNNPLPTGNTLWCVLGPLCRQTQMLTTHSHLHDGFNGYQWGMPRSLYCVSNNKKPNMPWLYSACSSSWDESHILGHPRHAFSLGLAT